MIDLKYEYVDLDNLSGNTYNFKDMIRTKKTDIKYLWNKYCTQVEVNLIDGNKFIRSILSNSIPDDDKTLLDGVIKIIDAWIDYDRNKMACNNFRILDIIHYVEK